MKMNPFPKFVLIAVIVSAIIFGIMQLIKVPAVKNLVAPEGKQATTSVSKDVKKAMKDGAEIVNVGVVTWGGYAGGQYFNNGFNPSKDSRYFSEYGIFVKFQVLDDFNASRAAWKKGEVDLMWVTADAYPTETAGLIDAGYNPRFIFQADWSRKGDAIVAINGINSVADLSGKKIAVAPGTPSHSLLLKTLEANNMSYENITPVIVPSAIDAAAMFKAGKVDAAVVWSPDDADCVRTVRGSKVLISTGTAPFIIADGFFVNAQTLEKKHDAIVSFVEGFLRGAAEINTDPAAKQKAIQILMTGLNLDQQLAENAINNVRLTTFGDNLNFFGLNQSYTGVKGEDLYNQMGKMYSSIKVGDSFLAPSNLPAWRNVTDLSIIREIQSRGKLTSAGDAAEGEIKFTKASQKDITATALSRKSLTVTFATGSAALDQNAKLIIEMGFVDIAKQFASARIRIIGHTDNVGSREGNISLSKKRAKSVADFLVSEYGFDSNRFIIDGKGPDEPASTNDTEEGRAANRRTEFQLLNN
ncbi:MAG: phosphate ABC transporter substrate-binding/OmpA family protein [Nanoarchaeota archaeon]|nr:phosphate ABC transporter substrate-binding/OmpA family protein [Nanoarchaeota archaeon]